MFEQTFRNIDDILHKDAGCTSELDYTEQSSWLLFLKYLAALEEDKAAEAALEGRRFDFIVDGKVEGNLANAFLIVTPIVFVGSVVLWRGRHHVAGDLAAARAPVSSTP